ncbi:MAG: DUF2304 domain-containing protein [Rhodoglobus sp.]
MNPTTYILGIAAALAILLVVIEMLRRGHLRERHAIWWIVAGVLALVIGVFPAVLVWAASVLGVSLPTNLIFFVSITVLFLVCLQNSSELTRLEDKTRALAEEVTLLSLRLELLESQPGSEPPAPPTEQSSTK